MFCPSCGAKLSPGVAACPICGYAVGSQAARASGNNGQSGSNGIVCPKCGSKNIQYATSSSGGGVSFSNACCGSILLGPIGLLCGFLGSGVSTKEFWICKDCGNKFSNNEAKLNQKLVAEEKKNAALNKKKCAEYKAELAAARERDGDYATIRQHSEEAKQRLTKAEEAEKAFIKASALQSADPTLANLAKKQKAFVPAIILGVLLAVIGFAGIETIIVPILAVVAGAFLGSYCETRKEKARDALTGYCEEFRALKEATDSAKAEKARLQALVEKINFVETIDGKK